MPEEGRQLQTILLTGASGFVGRHFIEEAKDSYIIYALARRSHNEAGISPHPNIHWMMGDIAEEEQVRRLCQTIRDKCKIDFVLHLAGYYDFTLKPSPEYQRTNVIGTENILKVCKEMQIKRFIFSSSLLVSDFPETGHPLTELSPPDANNPYAESKRKAEELVIRYSDYFPCAIVRMAAIYSDWCEYGPLYMLLNLWLSHSWKKYFIPGKGNTALPYLHVKELNTFWIKLMEHHDYLSDIEVLIAGANGCVSQKELYEAATEYFHGTPRKAIHVHPWLAGLSILFSNLIGWIFRKPVFEKLWMLKYTDKRLTLDASFTQELLQWTPRYRYNIKRRLLLMIENMKRNPLAWKQKNFIMAHKTIAERPGLKLYNALLDIKEDIIREHIQFLTDPANEPEFPYYQRLDPRDLKDHITFITQMWETVILNGDRLHILDYASFLARTRFKQGYSLNELINALQHLAYLMENKLKNHPDLKHMEQNIYYEIVLTMQLIIDEIEEVQEQLSMGYQFDDKDDQIDENIFLM